jgi:hypothetical protein
MWLLTPCSRNIAIAVVAQRLHAKRDFAPKDVQGHARAAVDRSAIGIHLHLVTRRGLTDVTRKIDQTVARQDAACIGDARRGDLHHHSQLLGKGRGDKIIDRAQVDAKTAM